MLAQDEPTFEALRTLALNILDNDINLPLHDNDNTLFML
jgi:hypothetical protein